MPLTPYRLHGRRCKKNAKTYDRSELSCSCPIHIEGVLAGEFLRHSARTRSLERAYLLIHQAKELGRWEYDLPPSRTKHGPSMGEVTARKEISIADACNEFLAHISNHRRRNLRAGTLAHYRIVFGRLLGSPALDALQTGRGFRTWPASEGFVEARRLRYLSELDYLRVDEFLDTWQVSANTMRSRASKLKVFFKWCLDRKYISENPMERIELPEEEESERMPYKASEMEAILQTIRTRRFKIVTNAEVETFCLVMRWGGLSLIDAVLLRRSNLVGDEIRTWRRKTEGNKGKVFVVVPLPATVADRLRRLPPKADDYFFTGSGDLYTRRNSWQERFREVFRASGVPNAGTHRFRHTFATELLIQRVPLDTVALLLGHASSSTTRRHYRHLIDELYAGNSNVVRKLYATGYGPGADSPERGPEGTGT
jgi:integrase/recombinase XerD